MLIERAWGKAWTPAHQYGDEHCPPRLEHIPPHESRAGTAHRICVLTCEPSWLAVIQKANAALAGLGLERDRAARKGHTMTQLSESEKLLAQGCGKN